MASKWEQYEVQDDKVERKKKECPKCGSGVFMAKHEDRDTCGKCGYTEFRKKEKKEKEESEESEEE